MKRGDAPIPARIVDEARHRRKLAVSALAPDGLAAIFALRSVMLRDPDAEIRARAAERLRLAARGEGAFAACRAAVEEALGDALRDASPIVREAAARTAGVLGARGTEAALRAAARGDVSWRVRRASVRALARVAGERAHGALVDATDDPFWRVRHAAILALLARPSAEVPALSAARSPRQAAALAYLHAARRDKARAAADVTGNSASLAEEPAEPALVLGDDEPVDLGDDDPAVVAARLGAGAIDAADGALLVAALASSHEALRRVAVRLLGARGRLDELAAALRWLDEPRALYAADAVRRLLRRVPVEPLVERVLAGWASPRSLAWALREAARRRIDVPPDALAAAAADPDPEVRRAALRWSTSRGDVDPLIAALSDADETVRAAAIEALCGALDEPAVRAVLPGPERGLFEARALLAGVREWTGRALGSRADEWIEGVLAAATRVPWVDVRADAISLRSWRGALPEPERAELLQEPDPWIREAAVDARAGATLLVEDPDPFVRQAAARAALSSPRAAWSHEPASPREDSDAHAASHERETAHAIELARETTHASTPAREIPLASSPLSAAERQAAAHLAARSQDAWIRAQAAGALDARSEQGFALLLHLTRDAEPMVRAAAADALDRSADVLDRCLRLVASPRAGAGESDGAWPAASGVRLAAHARLVADPGVAALEAIAADLAAPDLPPADREALQSIALAYPDELHERVPSLKLPERRAPAAPPARPRAAFSILPARRPLGNTGLSVAPLGISGAGEMPLACFEAARDAGVNLFFWEPSHRALTLFAARAARRHDLVMVTGTYEADARTIERDVDRALRRLRVDALGVMLLFWVRSRARLTEGAFEALARLKQKGKVRAIGFSTHQRDLAEEALLAQPWDVLMCRLSAAHPGAERSLLPVAASRGVGVIAFSALCYGRLLSSGTLADPAGAEPLSDTRPVTATDCYRYSLAQPGVSLVLSSPRRWRELSENLSVLRSPALSPAEIARLRAHGERVRKGNQRFAALVHRP